MISAFGVVHKSYVPGHGYVQARKLTGGMKNLIRTRAAIKGEHPLAAAGYRTPGKKVTGQSAKGRLLYPDEAHGEVRSLNRKVATDVIGSEHKKAFQTQHGTLNPLNYSLEGASRPNGRGGGVLRMNPHASNPEATYRHEMAHLTPKRNPVRFFERTSSSDRRLGREEGRADYIGNKKRTPGEYPGSAEFQRGYSEVQNRMHANRKPRTFAVNRKGETVQKSAFGVMHR